MLHPLQQLILNLNLINNCEDFDTQRNKASQNSCKADPELSINFNRKRSYDNPYEKKEINYDKTK